MNSLFPDQSPLDFIINKSSRPPCKLVEAREELYYDACCGRVIKTMDRGQTFEDIHGDIIEAKFCKIIKFRPLKDDKIYFKNNLRTELTHSCLSDDIFIAIDRKYRTYDEYMLKSLSKKEYAKIIKRNIKNAEKRYYIPFAEKVGFVGPDGTIRLLSNWGTEAYPDQSDSMEIKPFQDDAQHYYYEEPMKKIVGILNDNVGQKWYFDEDNLPYNSENITKDTRVPV